MQKRRPALVISNTNYNKQTGFVAVCPITHGQMKLKEQGLLVDVINDKVNGSVNSLQLHTFDFRSRKAEKITELDDFSFVQVKQLIQFIF